MAKMNIKVSTGELRQKAEQISKLNASISEDWNSIKNKVEKSKDFWEGAASDKHQTMFMELVPLVEEVLARLGEHPTDLLEMAGVYEQVEKEVTQVASELPSSII